MTKAIALLSGGLDSILAAKLVSEQGIEVEAVNFLTLFCNRTIGVKKCLAGRSAADTLGIRLKIFEVSKEYFKIVVNPRYGYGRHMNPCIDCRIFMLKKAGEYMKARGASFLITGEVLGERPMSQRREAMRIIERDSGLNGLILRPLSAKLLEPTIPEKEGIVNRDKLLAIQGRCRRPQIEIAGQLNINNYPSPAGGCLLTYERFADKIRDLIRHKTDFTLSDVRLLKAGRHFRVSPEAKLIVGRNQEENRRLSDLAQEGDICFNPVGTMGPTGIGRGKFTDRYFSIASSIIARYSDRNGNQELHVEYKEIPHGETNVITTSPVPETELESMRI